MVQGGNITYVCKRCGCKFIGWASAKRLFCSRECSNPDPAGRFRKHGESKTRLYQIWCDMKNRCYCKSSPPYKYYGARGITVFAEWQNRYEAFRDWALSTGYVEPLELDRIDNNGNYEPGNCRWATRLQQMANTRKRCDGVTSKYKGVSRFTDGRRWRAQFNKNGTTKHLGLFKSQLSAALAYDDAAYELRGEFAYLNFPERKRSKESRRKEAV